MQRIDGIGLRDVQAVYSGPEGDLWQLVMGEQIHIGGMASSLELAEQAGISAGMVGIDLCCCMGAGMRFLVRCRGVQRTIGVDATERMVERGRTMCRTEGLDGQVTFQLADALASGLPTAGVDFVWGEDAWCYVTDKAKLIAEAVRLVRPGGIIAFTDWVEGPAQMSPTEAERFLRFMKFPSIQDIPGYAKLLEGNGCRVCVAKDTGRFAPYVDLYMKMLDMQLRYDALKILGFDANLFGQIATEFGFVQQLASAGKIAQGMFVARKG